MLRRSIVLLPVGLLVLGLRPACGAETEAVAADEETLRAAEVATDGPGLLAYFRSHTLRDEDRPRIQALIRQLGDDSFQRREQASAELVSLGPSVLPLLHQALRNPDPEVRRRAERALLDVERKASPEVLKAAARVLGQRKPTGAAEVLLPFLPGNDDPAVADEVCLALTALARRDGKAEPALVHALADPAPAIRAAAGEALCRAGCLEQHSAVRRLLRDADPIVRQRVALALVEARDREAVPVLIALLTELPRAEAERVEEMLLLLAGERAPAGDLDGDEAARRKYHDAWAAWWSKCGPGLELDRVEVLRRLLGYTLIAETREGVGTVREVDRKGQTRWHIGGLLNPIDAQMIDDRRVLIADYCGSQVSERNLRGEVLWKTRVNLPLGAQHLANGDTFIVTRDRLFEVDRTGRKVWTLDIGKGIAAACRLREGQVAILTTRGEFIRADREGKTLQSFRVGVVLSSGTNIQVLSNGHVLVPLYAANQVVEFDADGRQVWSAAVGRPTSVQRLSNGHTLVASRLSNLVLELDRKGQEVWAHRTDDRPLRVRRR